MRFKLKERWLWILTVLVLSGLLLFTNRPGAIRAQTSKSNDAKQYMLIFENVFMKIYNEYVDEQEADVLIHNAIDGMIKGLEDPHSALLKPKNYDNLKTETKGQYGGLGIQVGIREKKLTIIAPMEDTPAMEAGLEAEDKIVKINGTNCIGITLDEAVEKLRGKPGTSVTITIERAGNDLFDVTIIREIIDLKSVKYSTIQTNIAYLRIMSFSQNTPGQLMEALKALKGDKYDSLVLDLRNNPGGLLDVSLKIADLFMDEGVIVSTKGRVVYNNHVYKATPGTLVPTDIPMVVLVNRGSASASEILAGALQDTDRAVILGSRTFGKGSVQTVMNLDGGYGLRLTIAKYYTPNDRMIHGKGLEPDIRMDIPPLSQEEVRDIRQLNRTNILKEFVKDLPEGEIPEEDFKELQETLKAAGIELKDSIVRSRVLYAQTKKTPVYDLENDPQLRQAVQILKTREILNR